MRENRSQKPCRLSEEKAGKRSIVVLVVLCAALLYGSAAGQEGGPPLSINVVQSKQSYGPGDTVLIALDVGIPRHYHLYGNPLGPGIGRPLTIEINGGEGIAWLDIVKTVPKKFSPEIGDWVYAYEKQAIFCLRGIARDAGLVQGTIVFNGLECHTSCYPVHYEIPFTVAIAAGAPASAHFLSDRRFAKFLAGPAETMAFEKAEAATSQSQGSGALGSIGGLSEALSTNLPAWDYTPLEAKAGFSLWAAIFFAFLAGIILNAMPCVLPVLGVKILSFADASGKGRKNAVIHSIVFSAGILSVFLALAALASFANYSWGRQFQDPRALVGIIAVIVVFALGMFDVYMIAVPCSVANLEGRKSGGIWPDFFRGIFATILATPCSGPFLGAVLAWAVTQPPHAVFIVYGSIGAGMAFPYIMLASSKRLARLIPKPGPWMNDLKGFMGFLLLAFAVYLMFGLPDDMVEPAVLFCLAAAAAVAVYGRFAPWGSSIGRKLVSFAAASAIAAGGLYVSFYVVYPSFSSGRAAAAREESKVWQPFSADSLLAAHAAGRPAIVDFTANWCMNCQYNTLMVLSKKEVTAAIVKKGALALVVDMTMPHPVQDSLLRSLGSRSIPFLALFPGDDPRHPVVMRDILTKGSVLKAINGLR
jgi:thiol:disulfide interchange protein